MRLTTPRLILRPFEDRDLEIVAQINADPEAMRFFPSPYTREQTEARIAYYGAALARDGYGFLAAELRETGELAGILGLSHMDEETKRSIPDHPGVEVGWRIARTFWGQGLAPEGARACLDYAWNTLNLPEVVAITAQQNMPSRRVMEKIGMTYDPGADFDHPKVAPDSHVLRHVTYRIKNPLR